MDIDRIESPEKPLHRSTQGGSQKLLLTTKESFVSNSIFSRPPCSLSHRT